jgi:hypothetical protein
MKLKLKPQRVVMAAALMSAAAYAQTCYNTVQGIHNCGVAGDVMDHVTFDGGVSVAITASGNWFNTGVNISTTGFATTTVATGEGSWCGGVAHFTNDSATRTITFWEASAIDGIDHKPGIMATTAACSHT